MKCPFCGTLKTDVVDSRLSKDGASVRRRRECQECKRRYTTREKVEELAHEVIKRDGRHEKYERRKMIDGIKRACDKRKITREEIEKAAEEIERSLLDQNLFHDVTSEAIGENILKWLKQKDPLAYVRFASVFRGFKDLNDFSAEIRELLKKDREKDKEKERAREREKEKPKTYKEPLLFS